MRVDGPSPSKGIYPALGDRERQWCLQFNHALQLQEILYLSPVAQPCGEDPCWIERHLEDNFLKSDQVVSESSCEAIWVLGLGDGQWVGSAVKWLESSSERLLVIIETKVAHLRAFLRSDLSKGCWDHPRIALLLLDPHHEISGDSTLRLVPQLLSDTRAMGLSHPCYGQGPTQTMMWNLLKRAIAETQEMKRCYLLAPDLMAHALKNTPYLSSSKFHDRLGDWMDLPVVLCGAGPTLSESIEGLKRLKDKAILVSCGTASQVLMKAGLEPDWVAGVCPYFLHYDRFRRIDYLETPTLTGLIAHPGVMRASSSCRVFLKGLTRPQSLQFLEKTYGGSGTCEDYGPSVLTSSLKACFEMGCKKIILVGVDMCYLDDLKYGVGADVVMCSLRDERSHPDYSVQTNQAGESVVSNTPWLQERAWIENFLRTHEQLECIQTSSRSLPIQGALHASLQALSASAQVLVERDLAALSWHAYASAIDNPKISDRELLKEVGSRLSATRRLALESMKKLQVMAAGDSDFTAAQKLLASYLQTVQSQKLVGEFLGQMDAAIAGMQIRKFWQIGRDPALSSPKLQRMRKITLMIERLSLMSQRLLQLLEAIEDTAWQKQW